MKNLLKALCFLFIFNSFLFSNNILKKESVLVSNGKAVMFIFESDTCSYCELLKKDFLENKKMKSLAKKFNIYLINKEKEQDYVIGEKKKKETTTTLRMAFAVKATPNIVMFDKNWTKVFQLPGYADPSQMIVFMKFVLGVQENKYKLEDWQKYLKDNKM